MLTVCRAWKTIPELFQMSVLEQWWGIDCNAYGEIERFWDLTLGNATVIINKCSLIETLRLLFILIVEGIGRCKAYKTVSWQPDLFRGSRINKASIWECGQAVEKDLMSIYLPPHTSPKTSFTLAMYGEPSGQNLCLSNRSYVWLWGWVYRQQAVFSWAQASSWLQFLHWRNCPVPESPLVWKPV